MKKFLRLPIVIILLLGVGFLYIVKNPEFPLSQQLLQRLGVSLNQDTVPAATGLDLTNCISYFDGCNNCSVKDGKADACTLMYCETPAEPKCLQYANTGTEDLTNCISYFDGCNRCSMKNGKPEACTEMYCETPDQPRCLEYGTGIETTGPVGIANPASVACENNGGTLEIVTSSDGGQVGMCTLPDGTVCEERAYYRGECTANQGTDQGTVCTMEYAPVCASVAIQCIKAPCYPIEQTFSNTCMMNANKLATFLHDGECTK